MHGIKARAKDLLLYPLFFFFSFNKFFLILFFSLKFHFAWEETHKFLNLKNPSCGYDKKLR